VTRTRTGSPGSPTYGAGTIPLKVGAGREVASRDGLDVVAEGERV
jgi:hypothetical protein